MTITLHLSDEQLARLKREAAAEGLSVEEHAVRKLDIAEESNSDAFKQAADATFTEHAEAYRRLAQ